jgi:hypothetical protein
MHPAPHCRQAATNLPVHEVAHRQRLTAPSGTVLVLYGRFSVRPIDRSSPNTVRRNCAFAVTTPTQFSGTGPPSHGPHWKNTCSAGVASSWPEGEQLPVESGLFPDSTLIGAGGRLPQMLPAGGPGPSGRVRGIGRECGETAIIASFGPGACLAWMSGFFRQLFPIRKY